MFQENFEVRSGAGNLFTAEAFLEDDGLFRRNEEAGRGYEIACQFGFDEEALLERLFEADEAEWEEFMSRTRYLEPKGPLRQNGNGHRYGGDKSWQQHRCYGIPSVVIRRAADERYWRQLLQEEVAAHRQLDVTTDGEGEDSPACVFVDYTDEDLAAFAAEARQETGAFNIASAETELIIDLGDCTGRVCLRYSADGKSLTSAHCEVDALLLEE